jgi:hypothetical protein
MLLFTVWIRNDSVRIYPNFVIVYVQLYQILKRKNKMNLLKIKNYFINLLLSI